MTNPFAKFGGKVVGKTSSQPSQNTSQSDPFAKFGGRQVGRVQEESAGKSFARGAVQPGLGWLKKWTWPADLSSMMAEGESLAELEELDPHRLRELQQKFPGMGVPSEIDREKYMQAVQTAKGLAPTQSNLEAYLENKYGLPLTPQTQGQRLLRLSGNIAGITPGDFRTKALTGLFGGEISHQAQKAGVPEGLSNMLGGLGSQSRFNLNFAPRGARQVPKELTYLPPDVAGQTERFMQPSGPQFESEFGAGSALQNYLRQYPLQGAPTRQDIGGALTPEVLPPEPQAPQTRQTPLPQAPERFTPSGRNLSVSTERLPRGTLTRPAAGPVARTTEERIGRIISPSAIANPVAGARSVRDIVAQESQNDRDTMNQLYSRAEQFNQGITTVHPELATQLNNVLRELETVRTPSSVTNKMIQSAENLLSAIASRDDQGNITGYLPYNNQELVKNVRNMNETMDYDFTHGSSKNRLKQIVGMVNQAIDTAAQTTGNTQAIEANREANRSHINWQNTYGTRLVHPWLDLKDFEPEKMFGSATSPDAYAQLLPILQRSRPGSQMAQALKRTLVEERLKPFLGKSNKGSDEFNKELQSLESYLTPHEMQSIRDVYYQRPFANRRATNISQQRRTATEQYEEKKKLHMEKAKEAQKKRQEEEKHLEKRKQEAEKRYQQQVKEFTDLHHSEIEALNSLPEQLMKKLDTVSGVRTFKRDVAKAIMREKQEQNKAFTKMSPRQLQAEGEKVLENALDFKAYDLLHKGKVRPSDTAKPLSELLNDREAVALLKEYKGAEWVNDMRQLVKSLEGQEAAFAEFLEQQRPAFFKGKSELLPLLVLLKTNPKLFIAKMAYRTIAAPQYLRLWAQKAKMFKDRGKQAMGEKFNQSFETLFSAPSE